VEIRRLANYVLRILHRESAHIFGDMHATPHTDGTETIETPHSKV
jgi:hypothetical protein